jgi:hypothetical protein
VSSTRIGFQHILNFVFVRHSVTGFIAALQSVNERKTLRAEGGQNRSKSGIHLDEIFARMEEVARQNGDPAPIRSQVEITAAEAVRNGFVKIVPSGSGSSAPRYVATDDFYDMSLFVAALEGFDSMVADARVDGRFYDLFEELDAREF